MEWASFLERLALERPEAEAYLLPLAAPLADRLEDLDPVGLSPDRITQVLSLLEAAQAHRSSLQNVDALRRLVKTLRRRAALLYGYAGAPERAVLRCTPCATLGVPEEEELSPRERVRYLQRRAPNAEARRLLQWTLDHWSGERRTREGTGWQNAYVPTVERRPSWVRVYSSAAEEDGANGGSVSEWGAVGALRQVVFTLLKTGADQDRLEASRVVEGASTSRCWEEPLSAARNVLESQFNLMPGPVEGQVRLGAGPQAHRGRSADLAVAALLCGAVLDHTRQRRRLRIRQAVAVTGALNRNGITRPVDDDTLPLKVQTAFFSPKTRLVVPEGQRDEAASARDALLEDFPHGRLDVVGVGRLEELFYDRRLTRQRHIGRVRHAAQWLWDRRGAVASSIVITALLLVIGALLYGPIDRNPVQAEFTGASMIVQNDIGQTIERIRVGERVVGRLKRGRVRQAVAFADVAGGPANEVVWTAAIDSLDGAEVLRCKAVGADTLLWEQPLQLEAPFPNQEEIVTPTFRVRDFFVSDLNGDDPPELYVAAAHVTYSPGVLLQLGARTGTERQRYVHPGHLTDLEHRDLDDDEAGEVLASGYSNAYNDPVLTVLDSRHMAGHAPTTSEYTIAGLPLAEHHAYFRFPESPVQQAAPQRLQMVRKVRLEHSARLVSVEVLDGSRTRAEGPSYLVVHFNYRLQPTAVGTSSGYDRLAEKLVRSGILEAVPNSADFGRYRRRIRQWTGAGWKPPAIFQERQATGRPDDSEASYSE